MDEADVLKSLNSYQDKDKENLSRETKRYDVCRERQRCQKRKKLTKRSAELESSLVEIEVEDDLSKISEALRTF